MSKRKGTCIIDHTVNKKILYFFSIDLGFSIEDSRQMIGQFIYKDEIYQDIKTYRIM